MSGLRFVLGTFQETETPPAPSSEEIENVISNLSSQTTEPVVDLPERESVEATIPFWVWFLLIPVVLPLFLLLFRGKGTHRPANAARRLDLRTQPEGATYRERKAPAFVKHEAPPSDRDSDSLSESSTTSPLSSSPVSPVDSFDDEFEGSEAFSFDDEDGFDSAPGDIITPQSTTGTRLSPASVTHATHVAVQDNNVRLSAELAELRKEFVTLAARFEETRTNDKLPHLEQELEISHERFRETELRRKALAKQLDEANSRSLRLSSELALLQTQVDSLESRFGEATEVEQQLEAARQQLDTLTRKLEDTEKELQKSIQERTKLREELQRERSAGKALAQRCDNLESRVADTSAADALAARIKSMESENHSLELRLDQLQEAHGSLNRQLADAQAQLSEARASLEQHKNAPATDDDFRTSMLERKLAEKRKLLARVQAKLREKLELIDKMKMQHADSSED